MAQPSKPCRDPHCFNLRPCPIHSDKPFANAKSPNESLYHSPRWKRERRVFLAEHRLCVACLAQGVETKSTFVDHREPPHGDDVFFFDQSNWQAVCRYHSNFKTAAEIRERAKSR